jgi:hypothetical protein
VDETQAALHNTLQGAAPKVSRSIIFLGAAEATARQPACSVIGQLEARSAAIVRTVAGKAEQSCWPLAARKLYMDRAVAVAAFLLPLTIESRTAGLRLRGVQCRWVHVVVHGSWKGLRPPFPPGALRRFLADLGWDVLWAVAVAAAIVLLQRMKLDSAHFSHSRAANNPRPPPGGWVARARQLQLRFAVPSLVFASAELDLPATVIRRRLAEYRRNVVLPLVLVGLGAQRATPALPWSWIALRCSSRQQSATFLCWWLLRCSGRLSAGGDVCAVCGARSSGLAGHITSECNQAAVIASAFWDEGPAMAFVLPTSPAMFLRQLLYTERCVGDTVSLAEGLKGP